MKSDLVDTAVEVKHETPKAFLVFDGTREVWLPKSMVEIVGTKSAIATMPEWLAKDKELI